MTGPRAVAATLAWVAALGVTLAGLHSIDGVTPDPVPLESYAAGAEAARVVVALARGLALGLGCYLLAVTFVSLALRIAGAPRAAARVEAFAPVAVRRVLRGVTAALATATSLGGGSVPAAATGGEPAVVMRRLPPEESAGLQTGGADGPPVVMRRLPSPVAPPSVAPAPPAAPGEELPAGAREHVVQPGEHLWAVAEAVLTAARGRPVADGEVDPYWRLVVAENAAALADPDLVFPGQKVRVPPVPNLGADV